MGEEEGDGFLAPSPVLVVVVFVPSLLFLTNILTEDEIAPPPPTIPALVLATVFLVSMFSVLVGGEARVPGHALHHRRHLQGPTKIT